MRGFNLCVLGGTLDMSPAPFYFILFFLYFYFSHHSAQQPGHYADCPPFFTCGRLGVVGFPFSSTSNPECGSLILNCTDEKDPKVLISGQQRWFHVENMNYWERMIVLHDQDLLDQLESNRCDLLNNFSMPLSPSLYFNVTSPTYPFFKCKREKSHAHPEFFKKLHSYMGCNEDLYFSGDYNKSLPPLPEFLSTLCSPVQLPAPWWDPSKRASWWDPSKLASWWDPSKPVDKLTSLWAAEYSLSWHILPACYECLNVRRGLCLDSANGTFQCGGLNGGYAAGRGRRMKVVITKVVIGLSLFIFVILLLVLYYFLRKRCVTTRSLVFWKRTKNAQMWDDFLQNYEFLTPKRYSFSDIRKMANSFKDKLGEGGYGAVYKGKLHDGRLVAVKVLTESKGDGEQFINEVASISRTSHVNIVNLLGFCFEGSKRALIYEYMPNGSLDKFIYTKSLNSCWLLKWEMLYEIAVGIARGLEYLHRGCNMRIVHFDIKPHNILLDQDFCPKISDFGLAKLCSRKDSIMSMLGARGTIGYIAPEVFCKNYGRVSHKSDVYSYGMMVLEMVGGMHNTDTSVDCTSEICFPYWIYKRLELEEDLGLHGVLSEVEDEITRKMIVVGLWCMQTNPSDRPSMNRVLEMLEGNLESLETPPKPFLYSPERPPLDSSSASMSL